MKFPERYKPEESIEYRFHTHDVDVYDWPKFSSYYKNSFGSYWGAHPPDDAKRFYDLARHGDGEGFVVEIGRFGGGSLIPLAAGVKAGDRGQVLSIDIETTPLQNAILLLKLDVMGLSDWVIYTITSSLAQFWKQIDFPIRLIFFDGNHAYKHVKEEFPFWIEKVIDGGYIIFHDYHDDVKKAIEEIRQEIKLETISEDDMTLVTKKVPQGEAKLDTQIKVSAPSKQSAGKILTFNNHKEGAISRCLTFGKRLGYEMYFAGNDFKQSLGCDIRVDMFTGAYPDKETRLDDEHWSHSNEFWLKHKCFGELDDVIIKDIFFEEVMDTDFDFILVTRPEVLPIAEAIKKVKDIQIVVFSGNPLMGYPHEYPLVTSSMGDFEYHQGKKILFHEEILPEFLEYKPLVDEYRYIIRSFVPGTIFYPTTWFLNSLDRELKDFEFFYHGASGQDGAYETYEEGVPLYQNMYASIHLKENDGYGLVLTHIAATGNLVITSKPFYAGKTLYPIVEKWACCLPYPNVQQSTKIITEFTHDENRRKEQNKWVIDFLDFEGQAERLNTFLNEIRG